MRLPRPAFPDEQHRFGSLDIASFGQLLDLGGGNLRRLHRLTVEARDRPAITSLHLLAVLNVLSRTPPFVKRRAPRTDAPLTHFASPRGEKSGLGGCPRAQLDRQRVFVAASPIGERSCQ